MGKRSAALGCAKQEHASRRAATKLTVAAPFTPHRRASTTISAKITIGTSASPA
jgi:hypothetical protein